IYKERSFFPAPNPTPFLSSVALAKEDFQTFFSTFVLHLAKTKVPLKDFKKKNTYPYVEQNQK
ncbi:MAG: hypothetical protein IJV93_01250, partial [Lentisphaeria bacterium]|nr:hypothetical protein [Lentisphaeria bacterium]